MKTVVLILACVAAQTRLLAQEDVKIDKALICGQLTFAPGHLFRSNQTSFYIHGGIEAFLSDRLSFSGEAYYQLGMISAGESIFSHHNDFFLGAAWHFTKKSNDLFIGLQPGFTFSKLNAVNGMENIKGGVSPVLAVVAGYRFFVGKNFNFFLQSRMIAGNYAYYIPVNLAEFRFSAGLGFNLQTIR